MFKYRLTQKAVVDLAEIWNYTFDKWSENQADRYYYMLLENCNTVSLNPSLGKSYSIIMENLYGFKAGRHIIFYLCTEKSGIEIIRILHEQMDLENRINEK